MKKSKIKVLLIILIGIFFLGIGSGLFLMYGPYQGFRNWLITTAMTTMNHQYLATWFYSDEVINEVLANNKVIEPNEDSNTNLININTNSSNVNIYKDVYDREILDREDDDLYKIIEIKENGYEGFLAVIYDPSKIKLAVSKNIGVDGAINIEELD